MHGFGGASPPERGCIHHLETPLYGMKYPLSMGFVLSGFQHYVEIIVPHPRRSAMDLCQQSTIFLKFRKHNILNIAEPHRLPGSRFRIFLFNIFPAGLLGKSSTLNSNLGTLYAESLDFRKSFIFFSSMILLG